MALRTLFGRSRQREPDVVTRVKAMVYDALALPAETAVTVSEIVCADPGCPDMETIVLVLREGSGTVAYRICRPLDEITQQDVREALAGVGTGPQ